MKNTDSLTERDNQIQLPDIDIFYTQYRDDFIVYARKHAIALEDIKDVYQDAVIALYENIRSGKLTELTSSLKTYLFSIGKHLMLNKIRDGKRLSYMDDEEVNKVRTEELITPYPVLSEKQELMLRSSWQLSFKSSRAVCRSAEAKLIID